MGINRRQRLWLSAIGVGFVLLAGSVAATKRPWVDEGWFVSPAVDLATHGSFGTLQLDPQGSDVRVFKADAVLKGINQHTYWVMPFHLLEMAGWGKLFGFSPFSMRLPALLWGLVTLMSVAAIVRRLVPELPAAAWLASALLAADFTFVDSAADARMDMTCAALGFAGLAVYLTLREQSLQRAMWISHALAATAFLTHPNGIFAPVTLLVTMLWLDWKRLSAKTLVAIAVPYIVGFGIWGAYCLKWPDDFLAQFSANSAGRARDLLSPWVALARELSARYGVTYFPSWTTFGKVRGIGFVLAVVAVGIVAREGFARRLSGDRLLVVLTVLRFFMLAFGATGKYAYYLVHISPLFAALIGIAAVRLWTVGGAKTKAAVAAALCLYFVIQASVIGRDIARREYQTVYQPVISYLRSEIRPGDSVTGSGELSFGLGFYNPQLRDDPWLGYWSGRRASLIVQDKWHYDSMLDAAEGRHMPVAAFITAELNGRYELLKEISGYRIYRIRDAAQMGDK
jgi:hypothetical protein